jgi:hypothetical protein
MQNGIWLLKKCIGKMSIKLVVMLVSGIEPRTSSLKLFQYS